jgi:ribosome-associated translation inhibitor RaiA
MFQITDPIDAHITSVIARVEKHGDDEVPAVSIGLEIETANTIVTPSQESTRAPGSLVFFPKSAARRTTRWYDA